MSEWSVGKDVEGCGRGLIEGAISVFPGGTEKSHEELVGTAGHRTEL
jgi:hypothetical protein